MIDILLIGHDYRYELSEFLKLFSSEFSFLESSEVFDVNNEDEFDSLAISKKIYELSDLDNDILINRLHIDRDMYHISIISETIVISNNAISYQKELSEHLDFEKKFANSEKKIDNVIKSASKRLIQKSMFEFLKNRFDAYVPWGILTGIRPLKIVHSLLDEGLSEANVIDILKNNYLISDEKVDLLMKVAKRERKYIYPVDEDKISLYVSIPFCPTKCLYCSFPSHPLAKFGKLRDSYLEKLIYEAKGLGELIKLQGKSIETLYIGGGTPTALDAEQLDFLIKSLFEIFDLEQLEEFTVEAGRPDSITREKLEVLKRNNVTRISINPQTMNQDTLDKIGRNHTVQDIVDCFFMARELGFDNINMDLILGLPGETPDMVENTMKEIVKLNPENVTVHTLALKRASDLNINIEEYKSDLSSYKNMISMIEISQKYMSMYEYFPYYLYRQKHMLGNLENIGYSKDGKECMYNMQIMEEMQSNYAIGAGAVSKFVYLKENRIERVDDVKNVEIYIDRVDDMIDKKYAEVKKNGY